MMQNTLQPARAMAPPLPRPSLLNWKTAWFGLFVAAVVWSLYQAGLFQKALINPRGWTLAYRFIEASLHPDLSPDFLWLTLNATLTTLAFAVLGTLFSLIIGFFGGILASEVWWESVLPRQKQNARFEWYRLPWLAIRSILALVRAVHEIIWGLLFVNVIGLDPLTAILAIALPFGAVTAKVFSEILDETPRLPFTTLKNSGVSPAKAFAYTLLPQAFLDWVAYGFYRFECAIRAAAVLGIIGAGGLGFEIFLSLKTLKYEQIWTLFFALFLLNGLADYWSAVLRRRLGGSVHCSGGACLDLEGIQPTSRNLDRQRGDVLVRGSLWLVVGLIIFSFWYTGPDVSKLFSASALQNFGDVVRWPYPLKFAALPFATWLDLSLTTIAMSLLATAGAGVFGLLLAFPAANNFLLPGGLLDADGDGGWRRWGGITILVATRLILLISRSIPPPIWALVFLFVLFPGIMPGAVALGLYTVGVLGRLMAEVVENLDERPLRALKAQGATGAQVFGYGVLPPTFPRFVGYLLYRWEEVIRATVVIGLVGAGGLGRQLTEQLSRFDYAGVLTTLLIFVALIFIVDLISNAARHAFR
ncbi:MAG: ABC transporter permease subunit [Anaerolineae bacterium]|nr:ABC transporter permease subunit [Anaerolineae bacterium]